MLNKNLSFYLQTHMPIIVKAMGESILKSLTVEHIGSDVFATGETMGCFDGFIHIKINDGFEEISDLANESEFFNIIFCINRTNYQLQHFALNWMNDHNLFDILIKNPQYELRNEHREPMYGHDFK